MPERYFLFTCCSTNASISASTGKRKHFNPCACACACAYGSVKAVCFHGKIRIIVCSCACACGCVASENQPKETIYMKRFETIKLQWLTKVIKYKGFETIKLQWLSYPQFAPVLCSYFRSSVFGTQRGRKNEKQNLPLSFSSDSVDDGWCFRTNSNVPITANAIKRMRMIRKYVRRIAKVFLWEDRLCAFNRRLAVGCFVVWLDTIKVSLQSRRDFFERALTS